MGRTTVTGGAARRWVALAAAALTVTGALVVGSGVAGPPTAAAALPAAADAFPPFPLPPLPGDMRSRGERAKQRFDGKGEQAPDKVAAWGVDEATGKLRVSVVGKQNAATERFTADTDPAAVETVTDAAPVRPYADLVGGQAIYSGNVRCSLGFTTFRGSTVYVLTAGHCTAGGGTWSGPDRRTTIGPVAASAYPTDDFGAIRRANVAGQRATARVQGGPTVRGSAVARVGAQVCRSGSTTGYRCGVIQAYNQTVNYGSGRTVSGLTRTTVCAEPGDSGGSFITPAGQAQGLTSGGSGNCTSGGTTYFQPIAEVLQRYGLRLLTG